jgi:UDP-N-acetylmuramoyl-L-alanyl-D-glutamate--2,6-diaminopimelate ligase
LHADADVTAQVLERSICEQTFLLTAGNEAVPVRTRMIGDHHVSNCLAAAAVGLSLGIDLPAIVRGLEAVDRVPGRMERLECGQPFGVFVDAAATPETLSLAIKSVRLVTRGRLLVVAAPRPDEAPERSALLGRVLERGAGAPIITSHGPGPRQSLDFAHDVLDGFERPGKARIIGNRAEAIRFALSQARPGDCVLITGRDHGLGGQASDFDDREIACEWLYSQNAPPCSPRLRIFG